jgi:hypothetical protein
LASGGTDVGRYARFEEFQEVRLKHNRPLSVRPKTNLDVPRAVTRRDRGVIVDVHDVEKPGYDVEFLAEGHIIDLLTLREDEIEPWE